MKNGANRLNRCEEFMLAQLLRSTIAKSLCIALVLLAFVTGASAGEPFTVTITSSKDNTLIEVADGSLSLGSAMGFYAGRIGPNNGGTVRRGLIAFDVASVIPEGAIIQEVKLELLVTMTVAGPESVVLKRLLADWGEGASDAFGGSGAPAEQNDATWTHRYWPSIEWRNVGGDFTDHVSASQTVHTIGWYMWQSDDMVADVQAWLDEPASNFGWLVQGNESELQTVKRFASREAFPDEVPKLTVTYIVGPAPRGDLDESGNVDVFDLLMLLAAWGPCDDASQCSADLDDSGTVDVIDLLELLANWG